MHGYRIEAYHVAKGIDYGTVVELLGDGEVLKLIIDEADMIMRRSAVKVDEHLLHRLVLIVT